MLNELQVLALRDHHSRVGMPQIVKSDPPRARTLERRQMLRIVNAYALPFFDKYLKREEPRLLEKSPGPYPEAALHTGTEP